MSLKWNQLSRSDIICGIIVPVLVVLLIVVISQLGGIFEDGFGVITGITMELQELVVIVAVPLMLGLVWNKWAGAASGFLMGSIYALYWADIYRSPFAGTSQGSGTVLLAYLLSAMLIGYVAGALNRRSERLSRLIVSGVTAATIGGLLLFGMFQLSSANVVTGIDGFLLTVLLRMACGAIIPLIAKVFMWYGVTRFSPRE